MASPPTSNVEENVGIVHPGRPPAVSLAVVRYSEEHSMTAFMHRWWIVVVLMACLPRAQAQTADSLSITTPTGIDERVYLSIGGVSQYVMIRGENRTNPVLLFLH